ncbi:POU class 2 homeobox associating factor 1 L homeolog isoform X2 [Xenopus laevis]|uniref:POU class 2 homeobox associating factor 1 L homeolog isoform X2 n=1 Tax=Xenopus laevis TaxID=8355 RepID=A0A8J1L7C3_XENLA|nr:POU class 2 homeobox associating factor 1 L homeolog isoform X2 [Xenopus laevis]
MHWQKSVNTEQQKNNPARPYLGVRVKEPVKELLKRKRGNCSNANSVSPTVLSSYQTYQTYPTCTPIDLPYVDMDIPTQALPIHDEGALYTSWISQPPSAAFQPLTQWTTCPDYISHETVSCPYTGDMYVQPMCQGYTVVGPPSVLTYTSQPLLTNFATRSTNPGVATQIEYTDHQAPLTYIPWAQPITTLPGTTHTIPYQTTPTTFQGAQFVPIPISLPEPVQQDLDDTRRVISNMPMEKLLQEDENNESYVLSHTLSIEGL